MAMTLRVTNALAFIRMLNATLSPSGATPILDLLMNDPVEAILSIPKRLSLISADTNAFKNVIRASIESGLLVAVPRLIPGQKSFSFAGFTIGV